MITDPDLEARIRQTLHTVAATTEVVGPAPTQLNQRYQRRFRPVLIAAAAFVGAILSVGAVALANWDSSSDVAGGPLAPAESCDGFSPGPPNFVPGTAAEIHPSLLYLPTYIPQELTLNKAWSTNAGDGCLHSAAFTLVDWATDGPARVAAAVIQVRYGIDFDYTHEEYALDLTGPPPGDHAFEVISYGPDGISGTVMGAVEASVSYEGATLEETMALLDRITLDEDTGALRLNGPTGRFELIPGANVEPPSQVLPLHNWYVSDLGSTSDEAELISLWVRFEPGVTAESRLRQGAELVTINDTMGVYFAIAGTADIEWELAPGVLATLHIQNVDLPRSELIAIAESVRPVAASDPAIPSHTSGSDSAP